MFTSAKDDSLVASDSHSFDEARKREKEKERIGNKNSGIQPHRAWRTPRAIYVGGQRGFVHGAESEISKRENERVSGHGTSFLSSVVPNITVTLQN